MTSCPSTFPPLHLFKHTGCLLFLECHTHAPNTLLQQPLAYLECSLSDTCRAHFFIVFRSLLRQNHFDGVILPSCKSNHSLHTLLISVPYLIFLLSCPLHLTHPSTSLSSLLSVLIHGLEARQGQSLKQCMKLRQLSVNMC